VSFAGPAYNLPLLAGAQFRLANDQFAELLAALSPIVPQLNALQLEVDQLKEDLDSKANYEGEINIIGVVTPGEVSGLYQIL
jgi:hypothetical protein